MNFHHHESSDHVDASRRRRWSSQSCSSVSVPESSRSSSDADADADAKTADANNNNNNNNNNNGSKTPSGMEDCRDFYVRRLQSLERFRQRVNHQQQQQILPEVVVTDPENRSMINDDETESCAAPESLRQLHSNMVALMEYDVSLIRQLITLGERIEELKAISSVAGRDSDSLTNSVLSLDDSDVVDEEDETEMDAKLAALSLAAGDDSDSDVEVTSLDVFAEKSRCETRSAVYNKQYFSRQNSVLRIPIRNRGKFEHHQHHPQHHLQQLQQQHQEQPTMAKRRLTPSREVSSLSSSSSSSGVSSSPGTDRKLRSIKKKNRVDPADQIHRSSIDLDDNDQRCVQAPHHASQSSCDSGVHHLNSLDLLERDNLVMV